MAICGVNTGLEQLTSLSGGIDFHPLLTVEQYGMILLAILNICELFNIVFLR